MKKILILISLVILVISGCAKKNTIDDHILIVGASVAPHAEILEEARAYIEEAGYILQIVEYTDYVTPNFSLQDGSLDANFFQHEPYLLQFNQENKTTLSSVLSIHFEPLGIYKGKGGELHNIKKGSKIAIPNDVTNCARALNLLASLELIEIDSSKGLLATEKDITANPYELVITALEAAIIPAQLSSFDYGVINGNYALSSGIDLTKLIATEDASSLAATQYANIVAVKTENINKEAVKVLIAALSQTKISEFILNKYDGLVLPVN